MVKEYIGVLLVIVFFECSELQDVQYDEKYYFVIFNYICDIGFLLYIMCILLLGLLEINDLLKWCVFYFFNEYYEGVLCLYMVEIVCSMVFDINSNM